MILKTIKNPNIAKRIRQTHEVQVPQRRPKTENPIAGNTLTITYIPNDELLEVYSLKGYFASFVGPQEMRDLELLTQVVARDCREIPGVKVNVIGRSSMNIGQTLICEG